nr:hypothetical protein CFP56_06765 [Quercus suber]
MTPVGRNLSLRAFIGSKATTPLGNMMLPTRASGFSSSKPWWNLDLNLHPQEEVEVPAKEAPQLDMDVYEEKDQDRIKEILDFQLRDKILKKENEIRRVLEGLIEGEIPKRKLSSSDFNFRNLDQFVGEVIDPHSHFVFILWILVRDGTCGFKGTRRPDDLSMPMYQKLEDQPLMRGMLLGTVGQAHSIAYDLDLSDLDSVDS